MRPTTEPHPAPIFKTTPSRRRRRPSPRPSPLPSIPPGHELCPVCLNDPDRVCTCIACDSTGLVRSETLA